MTTIDKDIADAIEKNLPAMIGEQLRKELEQLPKLRATLVAQENETKVARDSAAGWKAKAESLDAQLTAHQKLADREAAVLKREQAQDLNDLRVKLADERRADAVGLVREIFRSPVMTRTLNGTVPVPVDGHPGNPQYGQSPSGGMVLPGQVNVTETHEQR